MLIVATSAACAGAGSSSSAPASSQRRAELVRRFGDEVGLSATFPSAWYAQPYAATTLLITSFPIHMNDGHVWDATPGGGTVIQIYDEAPGSNRACRRLRGAHGHVRLGRFEPNYEGFGAAYRTEFHDHGHGVLAFTSFGGRPPTKDQRRLADRVLNSVHVEPGACPVKTIIAIGTRAAHRDPATTRSRAAAYAPTLSATRGPAGTAVTITGAIPPNGENGQPVHLARLVVWWNLDPAYPSPDVPALAAAQSGHLAKLGVIHLTAAQSRYRASFIVPKARPGRYPVVVLQEGRDGSVAGLGSASFVVALSR
jgi:hypothetical protein